MSRFNQGVMLAAALCLPSAALAAAAKALDVGRFAIVGHQRANADHDWRIKLANEPLMGVSSVYRSVPIVTLGKTAARIQFTLDRKGRCGSATIDRTIPISWFDQGRDVGVRGAASDCTLIISQKGGERASLHFAFSDIHVLDLVGGSPAWLKETWNGENRWAARRYPGNFTARQEIKDSGRHWRTSGKAFTISGDILGHSGDVGRFVYYTLEAARTRSDIGKVRRDRFVSAIATFLGPELLKQGGRLTDEMREAMAEIAASGGRWFTAGALKVAKTLAAKGSSLGDIGLTLSQLSKRPRYQLPYNKGWLTY